MIPAGAEIQIENGYMRIHPAIFEALAQARLTGQEFRAVLFLLRKTYGWQKKEDAISLAQWMEGLGLTHRHHVRPILDSLIAKRIIFQNGNDSQNHAGIYGFNKYIEQWQVDGVTPQGNSANEQGVTPQGDTPVTPQGNTPVTLERNTPVTPQGNYKRNPKDTIKETVKEKIDSDFGAAVTRYEHGIGVVTKDLREKMGVMWDELKAQGVTEWWDLAIATAKSYDAYSWPYMSKVLERSLATEKPPAPKQNGNGVAPAPKPAKRKQRIILPDGQTAEVEV